MLSPHVSAPLAVAALCSAVVASAATTVTAPAEKRTFNLPRGDAATTLKQFAADAGTPIVYLVDRVRGITTHAVIGEFTPREALDRMLAGSALEAAQDTASGALVVSRKRTAEATPRKGEVGPVSDQQPNNRKSMTPKSLPARLTAVFIAITSAVSSAQTAPTSKPATEEAIVLTPFAVSAAQDKGYRASNSVSGSRIDTPIKDLPFALQAFTSEFIADINPHELYDIVKFSPGVTFAGSDFAGGNTQFRIRGFDTLSNPLRNGFSGPPVVDSANIARVEVVKGPASFLYGQLAPGGLVNIITKRPLARQETTLRQEFGTDHFLRTQADTTGPIPNTNLFYRLAGSWQNDFQYYKPYEAKQWTLAPSALWQVTRNASISVDFEHFVKNENSPLMMIPNIGFPTPAGYKYPPFLGPAYPVPRDWNYADNADFRDTVIDNLVINSEFKLDEHWNARASYAFLFRDIEHFAHGNFSTGNTASTNAGNIPATATLPLILQKDAMGRRPRQLKEDGYQHTYQAEAVGNYKFGGISARFLFGYQKDTIRSNSAIWQQPVALWPRPWDLSNPATWDRNAPAVTKGSADLPLTAKNQADIDIEAYWAGVTLGFLRDRLNLLIGTRHTETENRSFNKITGAKNPDFNRKRNTPQLGVLYKVTDDISAFASMSESFVPNNSLLRVVDVPTSPAEPTVGKGWDVGVKTSLLNGRISGTLSYYEVQNTNIVQSIALYLPSGATGFTDFQSGIQESKGVELDAVFSPNDSWQIYAAFSHLNPIYKKNPAFLLMEGQPLGGSTRNLASLWTKYRFTQEGIKGAFIAGGFTWQDQMQVRAIDPDLVFPAYALFDLLVGYEFKWNNRRTTIDLAGKNLADKYYLPSNNTRGQPRRFILSVSTKF